MAVKKLAKIAASIVSLVLASSVCMAATCDSGSDSSSSSSLISSIIDSVSESLSDSSSTDSSSTDSSSLDSSGSDSDSTDSSSSYSSGSEESGTDPSGGGSSDIGQLVASQDLLSVSVDENGNLSYANTTELNMNVGYNTANTMSISYTTSNFSGSVVMLDGVDYSAGSLKPAWQALSDALDVQLKDCYTNLSATEQIITNFSTGSLDSYNIVTAQASTIVTAGTEDADLFLDLSQYLDYMPNYKKFLEDNPVTYMSLISDTSTGAMYYAPYFDGNDDIEKYEIAKKNWISIVLDGAYSASKTVTFADQATAKKSALKGSNVSTSDVGLNGTSSSVESYMGTTGSWWIESTDPSDENRTVTITVNYDDALKAVKDETTSLGYAYKAAAGSVYSGTSGNIVDIQNEAINATSGAVTGDQLIQILRAYIDVAYQDTNGNKYYSTRGDVFNGSDAAWDVDLLVALMRCIVTIGNSNLNTDTGNAYIYGVTGRQTTTQRMNDMVSLAGELYGVRGLASRYNYTYIDSNGVLQDARLDEASYNALDKMHAMAEEGLYNASETQGSGTNSYYTSATECEALLAWDYVQTETANGGYTAMGVSSKATIEDGYDFEPIVTPVSKWNDGDTSTKANMDGISYCYDGNSKYMRFTESWRSVKNTGFCVPYASVANDPEKLAATLAVIDYIFSNDGQIVMTFGSMSTTNNATTSTADYVGYMDNGWWFGTEVTSVDISTVATMVGGQYYINDEYASLYFCYNNKLYTGTYYNGRQYPTMTNANMAFYYGYSVNGVSQSSTSGFAKTGVLLFTNYCRYIIGSALPIGNKLQAFEYECTSNQGRNGADIVAAGLVNGTISHVYQTVGEENGKGYWYTNVPTALPYSADVSAWIEANVQDTLEDTVFWVNSRVYNNFYIDIIYYGLGTTNCTLTYISSSTVMPSSAEECINLLDSTYSLGTYESYRQAAWQDILTYYNSYIK